MTQQTMTRVYDLASAINRSPNAIIAACKELGFASVTHHLQSLDAQQVAAVRVHPCVTNSPPRRPLGDRPVSSTVNVPAPRMVGVQLRPIMANASQSKLLPTAAPKAPVPPTPQLRKELPPPRPLQPASPLSPDEEEEDDDVELVPPPREQRILHDDFGSDDLVTEALELKNALKTLLDERNPRTIRAIRAAYVVFLRSAVDKIARRLEELGGQTGSCVLHQDEEPGFGHCQSCLRELDHVERLVRVRNALCHAEEVSHFRISDIDMKRFLAVDEWIDAMLGNHPRFWPCRFKEQPFRQKGRRERSYDDEDRHWHRNNRNLRY